MAQIAADWPGDQTEWLRWLTRWRRKGYLRKRRRRNYDAMPDGRTKEKEVPLWRETRERRESRAVFSGDVAARSPTLPEGTLFPVRLSLWVRLSVRQTDADDLFGSRDCYGSLVSPTHSLHPARFVVVSRKCTFQVHIGETLQSDGRRGRLFYWRFGARAS